MSCHPLQSVEPSCSGSFVEIRPLRGAIEVNSAPCVVCKFEYLGNFLNIWHTFLSKLHRTPGDPVAPWQHFASSSRPSPWRWKQHSHRGCITFQRRRCGFEQNGADPAEKEDVLGVQDGPLPVSNGVIIINHKKRPSEWIVEVIIPFILWICQIFSFFDFPKIASRSLKWWFHQPLFCDVSGGGMHCKTLSAKKTNTSWRWSFWGWSVSTLFSMNVIAYIYFYISICHNYILIEPKWPPTLEDFTHKSGRSHPPNKGGSTIGFYVVQGGPLRSL